jgi:hypothetical protein
MWFAITVHIGTMMGVDMLQTLVDSAQRTALSAHYLALLRR